MTPERWRQLKKVAARAMSVAPERRAEYIRRACGGDNELMSDVESLLDADENPDDVLARAIGEAATEIRGPTVDLDDLSGRQIGRYRIVERVGEGGMGVVYRAEDTKLGRSVALKVLRPRLLETAEARKRFEREARAAAVLYHPNICTVHEVDQADGQMFITMGFLNGQILSERIAQGPLPTQAVLAIAVQLADGLAAANACGVVHRDLKPGNVMLLETPPGLVKIMDFGLAAVRGVSKLTLDGARFGTISYMSPEQAKGGDVDHRSDIWSLGVMLYEMIAGRPPFRGHFDEAVIYSILHEDPEPLEKLAPDTPRALTRIVSKALAKEPDDRYPRVEDMGQDLRRLQETSGQNIPVAPGSRRTGAWLKRAAAGVLALAAGVIWWASRSSLAPDSIGLTLRPLSIAGYSAWPAFSPDGEQLAFSWAGPENNSPGAPLDIYIKTLGGTPRRLSDHPDREDRPVWSPDGSAIAWVRTVGEGLGPEPCQVMVAPSVGGPAQTWGGFGVEEGFNGRLGRFDRFCSSIAWTRDGRHLIVAEGSPPGLFVLSRDGKRTRIVSSPDGWDSGPTVSPDGRRLAFLRHYVALGESEIVVAELAEDGKPIGDPLGLTRDNQLVWSMSWTPDAEALVYVAGGRRGSRRSLWRLPLAGPDMPPQRLGDATNIFGVSVAPQGDRLAFNRGVIEYGFSRMEWNEATGEIGDPTPLGPVLGDNCCLQFSPDGKQLAFSSIRDLYSAIFVADADGSDARLLHSEQQSNAFDPQWSPDGRRISFTIENLASPAKWAIFAIALDGGPPIPMAEDGMPRYRASWSSDGEELYFGSTSGGRLEIWKQRFGGPPKLFTKNGGAQAHESPDGRIVYFMKVRGGALFRMPTGGGKELQIADRVWRTSFTVFGDSVYFIAPNTGAIAQPFRIMRYTRGGATETIKVLPDDAYLGEGLAVSEEAGAIVYSDLKRFESEILLVEDFR